MRGSLRTVCAILLSAASVLTAGCTSISENSDSGEKNTGKEAFVPEVTLTYEAEGAALSGNAAVPEKLSKTGYSGSGYVEGFETDEDACTFSIIIPKTDFYDLDFLSASMGGEKYNYVTVDGEEMGTVYTDQEQFSSSVLTHVYMEEGEHTVAFRTYWGWISLDKLVITTAEPVDTAIYHVTAKLSNKEASEETRRLYSYLCDIYGTKFLSGQTCDQGLFGKEVQVIKKETGKMPAVLAMDFMDYSPSRVAHGTEGHTTEYAISYWEQGGIVAFHWHWTPPEKYITGDWGGSFYTEKTNIDLEKIMNGEDEEGYELLMSDMDVIAQQLTILKENNIPILFRPLHEASGGWFWWGASGSEAYKKLYIAMYEKFTKEYDLNNLIWVWNGQDAGWYPGDEYVDIIGEDIYPGEHVYTSQADAYFNAAKNYSQETKLVYLTENGCLFDPDLARRDGAMWGMWCTWQGDFVVKNMAIMSLSEQYTEEDMLKKVYADKDVITLSDLPDLTTYPIREELQR